MDNEGAKAVFEAARHRDLARFQPALQAWRRLPLAKGEAGAREGRRVSIATDMNSTLLISPCRARAGASSSSPIRPLWIRRDTVAERAQFEGVAAGARAIRAGRRLRGARGGARRGARGGVRRRSPARRAVQTLPRSKLLAQQDAAAERTRRRSGRPSPRPASCPSSRNRSARAVLEPLTRSARSATSRRSRRRAQAADRRDGAPPPRAPRAIAGSRGVRVLARIRLQ